MKLSFNFALVLATTTNVFLSRFSGAEQQLRGVSNKRNNNNNNNNEHPAVNVGDDKKVYREEDDNEVSSSPRKLQPLPYKTWMTDNWDNISERSLKHLAIPGTHDSGSFSAANTIGVRNQSKDIKGQLEGGIRYFDIRVKTKPNEPSKFVMHHGGVHPKNDDQLLSKALDHFEEFAEANPKELIIIKFNAEDDKNLAIHKFLDRPQIRNRMVPVPSDTHEFHCMTLESVKDKSFIFIVENGTYNGYSGDNWNLLWKQTLWLEKTYEEWQSREGKLTLGAKMDELEDHLDYHTGIGNDVLFKSYDIGLWTINIHNSANNINPKVAEWVSDDWKERDLNIFTMDFFEDGGMVKALVDHNINNRNKMLHDGLLGESCRSHCDCQSGMCDSVTKQCLISSGEYQEQCESSDDCNAGLYCDRKENKCFYGYFKDPCAALDGQCQGDLECKINAEGNWGWCVGSGRPGDSCEDNSDCKSAICNSDSKECSTGEAGTKCSFDGDCNHYCHGGECYDGLKGDPCSIFGCQDGLTCYYYTNGDTYCDDTDFPFFLRH